MCLKSTGHLDLRSENSEKIVDLSKSICSEKNLTQKTQINVVKFTSHSDLTSSEKYLSQKKKNCGPLKINLLRKRKT